MSTILPILACFLSASPADAPEALLLADSGRSEYSIVVAEDATEPERHAAAELARFLREVSGAELPVRSGSGASGKTILVGPGAAAAAISPAEVAALGKEGYAIRSKGPTLAIVGGRPRGTLYGVYSFLEDRLGCRWFTPDVSRIPRAERIELRPIDARFVPILEARSTDYPNSRDADWAARNKINGTQTALDERRGGKISYGPFVHTFNSILDPAEHFAEHPEWFSEVNGKRVSGQTQLCMTNPEVLRIAIEKVRGWMRGQPSATIFSVSQNDWHNYCTCKECARITAEEGSPIGPYLRFVNAIADAVGDEFPDKAIDTLAYQFTRKPPRITVPRPNVIVRLCSIECCFAHPLVARPELDKPNHDFARDLRDWGEISNRLYIWDYVINYAHSVMPFPNLYSLKPNIDFFVKNGVRGIYEEANYFSRGGELAELRTWILAKILWDPSYDTDRAIDEFLDGYYEAAAWPLRRYIDLVHGKARMDGIHFRIFDGPGTPLFSDDVIRRSVDLLDEAAKAVADRPDVLHRVQVARLPIDYVRLARGPSHAAKPAEDPRAAWAEVQDLRGTFERWDAVARKEGLSMVSEGRRFESWSADTRKKLDELARSVPQPGGIAAQLYIWTQDWGAKGQRLEDHLDETFASTRRAGFAEVQGWLSSFATPESSAATAALLAKHGLSMTSAYTGGAMHADASAGPATDSILAQARNAARHGLRVVVMNPDTIGREKTDDELAVQARNLDRLGGALRERGLWLAIHTHDPEMRSGAREWYHILRNTDPAKVHFCLDLHWVYRGKQDPYKLLEDAGARVVDLHLRNSRDGVWSESFGEGDIDHAKVAEILKRIGYRGLLTIELAWEGATKPTRSVEEDLRLSREYAEKVLAPAVAGPR